jgi:uncharacterized membrane protein YbhN (UPF0104 family)
MYSGKIAVPPGGGGIVELLLLLLLLLLMTDSTGKSPLKESDEM